MSGSVNIPQIPGNLRVPGTYFGFDPSNANTAQQNYKTLIMGQVLAGSAWAAPGLVNQAAFSLGAQDARGNAGTGSMLALAVARFKARYDFGELWVLPLVDDPAAVAATGTITFAGTVLTTSTLSPYIDFQLASTLVQLGGSAAQVASVAAASINALPDMPVTAQAAGPVVTLTAKNKGAAGNDIDIRMNYRGTGGGEAIPPGITVTIASMSGGATNPQLATPLLSLADLPFEVIVSPYSDSGSIAALNQLMDDNVGRWSWQRKLYGHVYCARNATLAAATTYGVTNNGQHVSVLPMNASPLSPPELAAEIGAAIIEKVAQDPSLPLQYLTTNIPPPAPAARFAPPDRNVLLFDGLSTYKTVAGTVFLERMVTCYQINPAGVPDTSYLDCETMHTLGAVCRDLDTYLSSVLFGKKLVADDVSIPGGVAMTSPALIKATVDTRYRFLCEVPAWCQDPAGFAKRSYVQIAGLGVVKIYAPITLIGQLRIMEILVDFTKPT